MNSTSLIFDALLRNKTRFFLLVFTIFIAFLVFGLSAGVSSALSGGDGSISSRRLIVANRISFTQPLPISYIDKVRGIPGVTKVTDVTWFGGYFRDRRNVVIAFAVDPESYLSLYPNIVATADERSRFTSDKTGILVGDSLAKEFGWRVGQQIPISSEIYVNASSGRVWPFMVAGIFRGGTPKDDTNFLLLHRAYLNDGRANGADTVGQIVVETRSSSDNDAVIRAIDNLFTNAEVETKTQTEDAFNKAFVAQFANVGLIIVSVVSASFFTMLFVVGSTMIMSLQERLGELSVLKTIGFTSRRIFTLVLSEALLLSMVSASFGLATAWWATTQIQKNASGFAGSIVLEPSSIALGLGIAAVTGLAIGLFPALYAMRTSVIAGLRGHL